MAAHLLGARALTFFHNDHLSSTGVMTEQYGDPIPGSTTRYTPFGD